MRPRYPSNLDHSPQQRSLYWFPRLAWISLRVWKMSAQGVRDLEDVADNAVAGDTENGSTGVSVDGDDRRDMLHPSQMLNSARNAHRHIQLAGTRRLAGLPDLAALRQPTRIRNGSRAPERCADRGGQFPEALHVRLLADSTADRQDELGRRHVEIVTRAHLNEGAAADPRSHRRRRELTDRGRRNTLRWFERVGADGKHDDVLARKLDFDVDLLPVAAASRDETRLPGAPLQSHVLELEHIGREPETALRRDSGRIAKRVDAVRDESNGGLAIGDQSTDRGFQGIRVEIAR